MPSFSKYKLTIKQIRAQRTFGDMHSSSPFGSLVLNLRISTGFIRPSPSTSRPLRLWIYSISTFFVLYWLPLKTMSNSWFVAALLLVFMLFFIPFLKHYNWIRIPWLSTWLHSNAKVSKLEAIPGLPARPSSGFCWWNASIALFASTGTSFSWCDCTLACSSLQLLVPKHQLIQYSLSGLHHKHPQAFSSIPTHDFQHHTCDHQNTQKP